MFKIDLATKLIFKVDKEIVIFVSATYNIAFIKLSNGFIQSFKDGGCMTQTWGKKITSALVVLVTISLALLAAEGIIRLKNASMKNYDIEMWKYALKLKTPSDNPLIGHEHLPNKSATLQSVSIRTNEFGFRGAPITQANIQRRILFLGSSVTLGWGVEEEKILTSRLKQKFEANGQHVEILNAGIGNFNTARYVERFMTKLQALKPTDIVVQYILRDAEVLEPPKKNILLHHSQLATTAWIVISRYFSKFQEPTLEEHYKKVYQDEAKGFQEMQKQLERLAEYAKANHIQLYLAMTPDIHDLIDYKYAYIHEKMKNIATKLGYTYIDLLTNMQGIPPKDIWAMPGDPHPNALGHEKMADVLYPAIAQG